LRLVREHPRAVIAAVLSAGLVAGAVSAFAAGQSASADELTVSQDAYRTGWDRAEPGLTPAAVSSPDFGQQFSAQLDGQVYAQPLALGGTLIAATENDKAYGLDAATGAVLWSDDFGPAWPASTVGCADLTPNLGITSTPVYDPATGYVYLVAKVNDGTDQLHPRYYMHAVNPATGAEKPGFPVTIGGHPSNDVSATFDPASQGQRPGLLLLGGVVYAAFGSHCDFGTYRGYVAGVSTAGKQTALWSDETGAGNNGGGIWGGGGGLTSDGAGQIILATGNGVSPAAGPGNAPPGNLAESVVRLAVQSNGSLAATDFFSPSDAPTMDTNDTDLGSGGPMALPDGFGTAAHPHLLVQMGKDGRMFLLDRDDLGGRDQGANRGDAVLGVLGPYQGQWGHPGFWGGDGGYVYLVGNGGPLRAFKYGVTGTGQPALTMAGTSAQSFSYTSGSPVVTSTDSTSGTAVVWVVSSSGPSGTAGQLWAYNPIPDANGALQPLWSGPIGTAVKFTTPATSNGHVYVGTRDGKVLAFGRPATSPLTGSPAEIGSVAVGQTGNGTLTVTATQDLNITAVAATTPFAVTAPKLPYALASGASLSIPVAFTPGAAGAQSGTVTVTTDAGPVSFTATGTGTKPGLGATPANAVFDDQPVGVTSTQNVQVTNTGTSPETITAVTAPAAPFAVAGLPAVGDQIPAGGSFIASVTYAPSATATNTDSITIGSTSGSAPHSLSIPLNANAVVGQGHLVVTPQPVDFGTVALGSSATESFTVTNDGNIPVTITKAKAPDSEFTSNAPIPEGQVIGPDQVYVETVAFAPTVPGTRTDAYEITGDTGQGAMYVPLSGVAAATLPAAPTDWQLNGAAISPSAGTIQLTPATPELAGSAFSTLPVPTEGLFASFTAQLGGGSGADGLTFALADAVNSSTSALGAAGGGLGFSGTPGIAVAFNTFWNNQAGSDNYVGILAGPNSGSDAVTYLTTAVVPTALRTGTHNVAVSVNHGVISVFVDGKQLLAYPAPAGAIPAGAYAGFTGGTGGQTDVHTVSNVTIASVPGSALGRPLASSPASVRFPSLPGGARASGTVTLKNNGLMYEIVTAVTPASGRFTVTGLPAAGAVLAPGASIPLKLSAVLTGTAPYTGSFTITTTAGTTTVSLSAQPASSTTKITPGAVGRTPPKTVVRK